MSAETTAVVYHPDPETNAGVSADAIDAEREDLAAGFPPRRWRCVCGAEHSRGHFGTIGVHRCLVCGYTGAEGVMLDDGEASCLDHGGEGGASDVAAERVCNCTVRTSNTGDSMYQTTISVSDDDQIEPDLAPQFDVVFSSKGEFNIFMAAINTSVGHATVHELS